jgi:putative methionine-R-sulfoxide reductase with GAF domain
MVRKDRYRLLAILSFIVLVIALCILFIQLWNNFSLNPEINISYNVYLYLLIILAAALVLLLFNIFQSNEIQSDEIELPEITIIDEQSADSIQSPDQSGDLFFTPDIDIDEMATSIVPKIDFKEPIEDYTEKILQNLARQFNLVLGVFYLKNEKTSVFQPVSTYAWASESPPASFNSGEGLTGQAAKNRVQMKVDSIPDGYIKVLSGLGSGSPKNLLIVPLLLNKETIGIIEIASFMEFDKVKEWTIKYLAKIIANSIITKLKANQRK